MQLFCINLRIILIMLSILSCSLLKVFSKEIIPFCEGIESSVSLESVLCSKISLNYFQEFIRLNNKEYDLQVLELFQLIKIVEIDIDNLSFVNCREKGNLEREIKAISLNILRNYISNPKSRYIKSVIPQELHLVIKQKIDSMNFDKHIFDPLYGLILNRLQIIYKDFKSSSAFKKLQISLLKNEIIYERAHRSGLL